MNTILEQFNDKINGTFSFFDRIIIKGHIRQFFSTSGKGFFLSHKGWSAFFLLLSIARHFSLSSKMMES